ncbi:MAG: hypothetical protein E7049_10920 [Lentisphaerae bacterium]|nr:hypothetical protein [Lentisphaerota bacterium]
MKFFNIINDVKGRAYKDLIGMVGRYAATCQLVSHHEPMAQTCKETLSMLAKLGEEIAEVSEWHGTRLSCCNTARLHSFHVNEESLRFLANHVDSLFSWRWPDEPEDLCFLAPDRSPILISTAHEEWARLVLADSMRLSDCLMAVLEKAEVETVPCGFVVNMSALSSRGRNDRRYIGIEGEGWPVDLPGMPTIEHGLASADEFELSVAYWRGIMKVDGFEHAQLLYFGEQPPYDGFSLVGFDCGFYSNEIDNFSLILNELHRCSAPSIAGYKRFLNEYGLFVTREAAEMFLRDVLSDQTLSNVYRGCSEDLSVFKVYRYAHV